MEEFRRTVASNIVSLRVAAGLTQAELGEKLHYSDKSVSKWERGDALPDAFVLKQMATLFGVTVDDLLTPHEGNEPIPAKARRYSPQVVTSIAFFGVWAAAVLVFVLLLLLLSRALWQVFVITLPVSLLVVMILQFIWGNRVGNFLLLSAFVWSLLAAVFLCLPFSFGWAVFLLGVPAQILIFLSFHVKKRK